MKIPTTYGEGIITVDEFWKKLFSKFVEPKTGPALNEKVMLTPVPVNCFIDGDGDPGYCPGFF